MATAGQFYWPSVGIFVAAYGQFFMAANTQKPEQARLPLGVKPSLGLFP